VSIDRTNYNALVNDDGSNTVGTTIQKTTFKDVLLDPIDAELVAVGARPYIARAYAAGNYVGVGGGTWTVDSGDQAVHRYITAGRLCLVNVVLNATSITGTVTSLQITTIGPAAQTAYGVGLLYDNSLSVAVPCLLKMIAGTSTIVVTKLDGSAFAVSTNSTYVLFQLGFEF
jgi:hypothetical protein